MSPLMTEEAKWSATMRNGDTYHLVDTETDPSWSEVRVVEQHRAADGKLLSVVNYRRCSFEQRKAELLKCREGVVKQT